MVDIEIIITIESKIFRPTLRMCIIALETNLLVLSITFLQSFVVPEVVNIK